MEVGKGVSRHGLPTPRKRTPAPLVLQELRQATAAAHQDLERRLPFMADAFSLQDYIGLLRAYYGFYVPLEERLAPHARQIAGLKWPQRVKVDLLAQDLLRLGHSQAELNALRHCAELPAITSQAHALGCLYVVEGATLGGQVLRRQVWERLQIHAGTGAAFLNGYGPATGRRWRRFLTCLCWAEDAVARRAVVASAVATFETFSSWLGKTAILREPGDSA